MTQLYEYVRVILLQTLWIPMVLTLSAMFFWMPLTRWRRAVRQASSLRIPATVALIGPGVFGVLLYLLLILAIYEKDAWLGDATLLVLCGVTVALAIYVPGAVDRLADKDLAWLARHDVDHQQIRDLARERVRSNITTIIALSLPAVPIASGLAAAWRGGMKILGLAAAACLLPAFVLMAIIVILEVRMRSTDAFLRRLGRACDPESQPPAELPPHGPYTTLEPTRGPAELWSQARAPERYALLSALKPLHNTLWRRAKTLPGLDQKQLMLSTRPLFAELIDLANGTRPIGSSPTITRVIRVAVLGDLSPLGPGWAAPRDTTNYRAWNPSIVRRAVAILALVGSLVTPFLALLDKFRG
ncbi:hypothetical protein ACIA49_28180 [Kribbella sp. NPDC051587]|uniref:hypothetical protein n=1 Tax=Kribbella sp. NPDC051587 TaxID=3364119 RepID=UPI0037A9E6FB